MLKLININKSYSSSQVLFGINLEIWKWEIIWLLWPNWAWKSTTMKIMTWFLFPDSWEVLIDWYNIHENNNLKWKIWYLPETNPLYHEMWVDEFLSYAGELKWVKNIKKEVDRVIGLVWLKDKKKKYISTLSKWYKQRVWLAWALIWDPDILILDEPTEWLDPAQRDEIKKLILWLWKNKTIIISSHVLSEISNLITRVVIISEWKIKLNEKKENIWLMQEGRMRLHILYSWKINIEIIESKFKDIEITHSLENNLEKIEILTKTDIRKELFNFIKSKKIDVLEFYSQKANLEDVFFDVIQ